MAAGSVKQIWSVEDLLLSPVVRRGGFGEVRRLPEKTKLSAYNDTPRDPTDAETRLPGKLCGPGPAFPGHWIILRKLREHRQFPDHALGIFYVGSAGICAAQPDEIRPCPPAQGALSTSAVPGSRALLLAAGPHSVARRVPPCLHGAQQASASRTRCCTRPASVSTAAYSTRSA